MSFSLAREDAGAPKDRAVLVDYLGVALNVGGLDGVAAARLERFLELLVATVTLKGFSL